MKREGQNKRHFGFEWLELFNEKHRTPTIADFLKQNILFQNLSRNELQWLENVIHVRKYEEDETVFEQNERGLGVYIITAGKIEIRTTRGEALSAQERVVTYLRKGAFFGEQALIDQDSIRTASAYACEPTTLIAFLKPDLQDIILRKPELGAKILFQLSRVLSKRLRRTTAKLTELSFESGNETKSESHSKPRSA